MAARLTQYEEASAFLFFRPVELYVVVDVILDVAPVAERAVVNMLIDKILGVKV